MLKIIYIIYIKYHKYVADTNKLRITVLESSRYLVDVNRIQSNTITYSLDVTCQFEFSLFWTVKIEQPWTAVDDMYLRKPQIYPIKFRQWHKAIATKTYVCIHYKILH